MKKLLVYISFICCFGLSGLLGACTSDDMSVSKGRLASDVGKEVNLSLSVSIGEAVGKNKTRDGEDSGFGFMPTDDKYELINTLRVIVVRPDYTVEYNRLIIPTDKKATNVINSSNVGIDELKFLVSTDQGRVDDKAMTCTERKRVYLIANEATLNDLSSNSTSEGEKITNILDGFKPPYEPSDEEKENGAVGYRDKLYPNTLASLIVYNNWSESGDPGTNLNDQLASPIIDNQGKEKKYIPMTEFFDVDVVSSWSDPEGQNNSGYPVGPKDQTANLFITRCFVKFLFSAESYNETFEITRIRFENLSQKQYLFPLNAVYSPAKAVNDVANREIVSFTTPGAAGNLRRPYLFDPPTDKPFMFVPPAEGGKADPAVYDPLLYFCETNNFDVNEENKPIYKIGVDLEFKNAGGSVQPVSYESLTLPNLPNSLPRNTIVKIHFIVNDRKDLKAIVTLEPYISIELDPVFGDPQPYPFSEPE